MAIETILLRALPRLLITISYVAIKAFGADEKDSWQKTCLSGLENIVGSVFGNHCNEYFNEFEKNFSIDPNKNADIERTNRDALLNSLIDFITKALAHVNSESKYKNDKKKYINRFLNDVIEDFKKQINDLTNANVLTFNSIDKNTVSVALSKDSNRYEELKNELSKIAMKEFEKFPGMAQYFPPILEDWLTNGLSENNELTKIDWFNIYFFRFNENLKKVKGDLGYQLYHTRAQKAIFSAEQQEIKEVVLFTKKNIGKLVEILSKINQLQEELKTHGLKIDDIQFTTNNNKNTLDSVYKILNQVLDELKIRRTMIDDNKKITENITIRMSDDKNKQFFNASYKNGSLTQKQVLLNKLNENRKSRLITLHGMPGIGKSYLSQEIAHQFASALNGNRRFDIVWWIDSEELSKRDEDAEKNANEDLKSLARTSLLQIDPTIGGWLGRLKSTLIDYKFLLVFDNACDTGDTSKELSVKEFIELYFPAAIDINQQIIVTSRNGMWRDKIKLETWSVVDFKGYFELQGISTSDEEAFKIIYKELGGLVLAASVATAFISSRAGISIKKYSNLLTKQKEVYLTKLNPNQIPYRRAAIEDNIILNTFLLSYNSLEKHSQYLLNIIAFLAPDEIPLESFFDNFIENESKVDYIFKNTFSEVTQLNASIDTLTQFSLIDQVSNEGDYSIHRLLKESLVIFLKDNDDQEIWIEEIINLLILTTDNFKSVNYTYYRKLLPHVEALAQYQSALTKESTRNNLITLMKNTAKYSFETGAIAIAMRLYNKVIDMVEGNFTLIHQINIDKAYGLMLQDKCNDALLLVEGALYYFYKEYNGVDKLELVEKSRQNIGKIFQRKGNYFVAKEKLRECQERIRLFKDGAVGKKLYSGILHDLAAIYWDEGLNFEKSLEYFDEAINYKLDRNNRDNNDRHLNYSRMIRGVVYGLLGDYEKQYNEHKIAFNVFSSLRDSEFRRYAYTAYYLIHFAWDKLGWANRSEQLPEEYNEYLEKYNDYDEILEGDVKYALIKNIIDLRKTIRSEIDINNQKSSIADGYFRMLKNLLDQKFNGERYIDDGTVAVSGVLDYALYLEENSQTIDALHVADYAKRLVSYINEPSKKIIYHRRFELDNLLTRMNRFRSKNDV